MVPDAAGGLAPAANQGERDENPSLPVSQMGTVPPKVPSPPVETGRRGSQQLPRLPLECKPRRIDGQGPRSPPQLLGGEAGAFGQGFQFGPGDLRVDAAAEPAIGRGDDPFATDDVGEAPDAV
jgi:hypothetical protein